MAHNGGQLQANVNFANPRTESIFLNVIKVAEGIWFAASGTPGTDWAGLLQSNGYPSAMPAGGAFWRRYSYIYGRVGDTFEFFYPAAHTCRVVPSGFTATEAVIAPGHKQYTLTVVPTEGASMLVQIDITAMSGSDWTAGMSLYRTEHQAEYDIDPDGFDPRFLARYGYGTGKTPFGIIRTMNWGGGFGNQRLYTHRHLTSDCSYLSELVDDRYFAGTATKSLNRYTTATRFPGNPGSWTDGQMVQFWMATPPTRLSITATTMGATTSFACASHGLTTGDEVELERDNKPTGQLLAAMDTKSAVTGLPLKWAVTVTDANNFTIPINSTGFSAVGAFKLLPLITAGDGTLAQKRCVSADINGQFYSSYEFSTPGLMSGCYNAEFGVIILRGNSAIYPGIPLEQQAKLCNKLKSHWWLSVPIYFTGAEERAYIASARALLDSELLLILEKANEIWNNSFSANPYAGSLAALRGYGSVNELVGQGILHNDLADNAATQLGALATNYRVVMCLQNASDYATFIPTTKCGFLSGYVSAGTPGNSALYPANKVDAIAVAPYVSNNFAFPSITSANYPGWITCLKNWLGNYKQMAFEWFTQEELVPSSNVLGDWFPLNRQVNAGLTGIVDAWVAGKSAFTGRRGGGIEIWCYEGVDHNLGADWMDQGFPTGGVTATDIDNFYKEYKRSQQYANFTTAYLYALKNAGVTWPSVYTAAGQWASDGMWGQWPTNDHFETAPPGWTACYDFNRGVRSGSALGLRFRV